MLALCTLSIETAEQLKASSALLPALPKPLLQVSQSLSMTINAKVDVERRPSNEHSNTQPFNKTCADAGAYHTFMSSVHGPKIISFIFHSSVINTVFTSSWDYAILTGVAGGLSAMRGEAEPEISFTLLSPGQLHSHKMTMTRQGDLLWGIRLPTRSQFLPNQFMSYIKEQ